MFAVATTRCSNTCYKVQFRVERQSKYNFSCQLEIAANVGVCGAHLLNS